METIFTFAVNGIDTENFEIAKHPVTGKFNLRYEKNGQMQSSYCKFTEDMSEDEIREEIEESWGNAKGFPVAEIFAAIHPAPIQEETLTETEVFEFAKPLTETAAQTVVVTVKPTKAGKIRTRVTGEYIPSAFQVDYVDGLEDGTISFAEFAAELKRLGYKPVYSNGKAKFAADFQFERPVGKLLFMHELKNGQPYFIEAEPTEGGVEQQFAWCESSLNFFNAALV